MAGRRRSGPRRFHESELVVRIECPACGLYLGRTVTVETRDRALQTHATACRGAA